MKKVLFVILLFVFVTRINALEFKTSMNNLDDLMFYEGNDASFKVTIEKNKYFDNYLCIRYLDDSIKQYKYVVHYYDEDKKELDKAYGYEYTSTSHYIEIVDNAKYYKLVMVSVTDEEYTHYNPINALEINENELNEVKLTKLYSDDCKKDNDFYLDNFNINADVYENENGYYIISYTYNFDLVVNKDTSEYIFDLLDNDFKNLKVKLSDTNIIYTLDKYSVSLYGLKKGTVNVEISYDIKEEYAKSYGLSLRLFKNHYENNLFDYITFNINLPFTMDEEESLYCGQDCYISSIIDEGNNKVMNIKGKYDKTNLHLFVKKLKAKKDIKINLYLLIFIINAIIFILSMVFKDKFKKSYILSIIGCSLVFIPLFYDNDLDYYVETAIVFLLVIMFIYWIFTCVLFMYMNGIKNKNNKITIVPLIITFIFILISANIMHNEYNVKIINVVFTNISILLCMYNISSLFVKRIKERK